MTPASQSGAAHIHFTANVVNTECFAFFGTIFYDNVTKAMWVGEIFTSYMFTLFEEKFIFHLQNDMKVTATVCSCLVVVNGFLCVAMKLLDCH